MGDVSNKTLAALLVVSVLVSLFGTFFALNKIQQVTVIGAATTNDTGIATLEINTTASIIFSRDTINWGSGYVNASGYTNCTMDTTGGLSAGCVDFTQVTEGLVIENDGNMNFTYIYLNSDKNATEFIGGDSSIAEFQWIISENETGSCSQIYQNDTWYDVDTTTPGAKICDNFNFLNNKDSIKVDLRVVVPYDAPQGTKTATLTVTGEY